MFIPNTTGMLSRANGRDVYGQFQWSAPAQVRCAVVHLNKLIQKTSVRTDSSASRGNAEETIATAKILFPTSVAIGAEDKFEIQGFKMRVTAIEPRRSVLGKHDHNEVDFEILP